MPKERPRVLVVAAEATLQLLIKRALANNGFQVLCTNDSGMVQALVIQEDPNVVLLDLRLAPIANDETWCAVPQISRVPIIGMVASDSPSSIKDAFSLGVDDVLMMPFVREELLARLHAVLHRSQRHRGASLAEVIHVDGLTLYLGSRRLLRQGRNIHLSRTEWALLEALVRHAGAVLTHRQLLNAVWGEVYGLEADYLRTYVYRLRHKLEDDPHRPKHILTEPGVGYRFSKIEVESPQRGDGSPALRTSHAYHRHRTELLLPATRLIGRNGIVAAVRNRLQHPDVRLLTLVGAPGCGKTRVGLHAAKDLIGCFEDGLVFVSLEECPTLPVVVATIARALDMDICESPEQHQDGRLLIGQIALRARQMLLVLDSFERVLSATALVADLLAAAPHLKILVMSRAPLHIRGEYVIPVPPLEVPDTDRLLPLEELASTPTVALFVERAAAASPEFALTEANAGAVTEICRRLDGLPLAIELAAARMTMLTPQSLLLHLHRSLDILAGGMHDLPPRQQTLSAAIAWSYDLLDASAQALLHRLALLNSTFSLETVQDAAGCSGNTTTRGVQCNYDQPCKCASLDKLLFPLQSLLDHSLLIRSPGRHGEPHFTLLNTIRAYVLAQVQRSGDGVAFL